MGRHSVWLVLAMLLALQASAFGQTVAVAQLSGPVMDQSTSLTTHRVTTTLGDPSIRPFAIKCGF